MVWRITTFIKSLSHWNCHCEVDHCSFKTLLLRKWSSWPRLYIKTFTYVLFQNLDSASTYIPLSGCLRLYIDTILKSHRIELHGFVYIKKNMCWVKTYTDIHKNVRSLLTVHKPEFISKRE